MYWRRWGLREQEKDVLRMPKLHIGAPWMNWMRRTIFPYNFRKFFSGFGMPIESVHNVTSHLLVLLYLLSKILTLSRIEASPLVVHAAVQNSQRTEGNCN